MGKTEKELEETIVSIGLFLGALWLGNKIIESLSEIRCPYCGKPVSKGAHNCPHCGGVLLW